ncbi:MAG: hypothetical protein QOE92_625 [Chloroflexota bacterium]|nr:hypothetical protein [Chloroflexota bacterium]
MLVAAVPMLLVGGVWVGQGLGYIKGSFMTGSGFWAVAGVVLVLVGIGTLVAAARRGPAG